MKKQVDAQVWSSFAFFFTVCCPLPRNLLRRILSRLGCCYKIRHNDAFNRLSFNSGRYIWCGRLMEIFFSFQVASEQPPEAVKPLWADPPSARKWVMKKLKTLPATSISRGILFVLLSHFIVFKLRLWSFIAFHVPNCWYLETDGHHSCTV